MSLIDRITITAAVAYSAISLYDAVFHGVFGRGSIFSDEYGTTWASVAGSLVSTIAFTAFALALTRAHLQIDAGSRVRRWIRRLLTIDFAILAVVFAVGSPFFGDPDSQVAAALGVPAGVAFAAMFVLAFALGVSILHMNERRISAILLIAVIPLIGVTIALNAVGSDFAHPAYAETAIYLGVALLCRRPTSASGSTDTANPRMTVAT